VFILTFAKPKKAMSSEDYANSTAADGAPPGCYTGNMSKEARLLWKAKLVGSRSGNHQIEIRTTSPRSNLVVVVNGAMLSGKRVKSWDRLLLQPFSVKISANGPTFYTPDLWETLQKAVEEARGALLLLDAEDTRTATLKRIQGGEHPLGSTP